MPYRYAPAPDILAVRFSAIGDILLVTPLLRAIRSLHPGARITVLTKAPFVPLLSHNPHLNEVIGIELPLTVELEITECDPSVRGNSATSRSKKATLETGLVVQVPEHLSQGDRVRLDTTTGKFVARVSK